LSNHESKIIALSGALGLPFGGGIFLITASRISLVPIPSFADARIASLESIPKYLQFAV